GRLVSERRLSRRRLGRCRWLRRCSGWRRWWRRLFGHHGHCRSAGSARAGRNADCCGRHRWRPDLGRLGTVRPGWPRPCVDRLELTMALAILKNGVWERWDGWLDEAQHNTLDVERCWSPAELADA